MGEKGIVLAETGSMVKFSVHEVDLLVRSLCCKEFDLEDTLSLISDAGDNVDYLKGVRSDLATVQSLLIKVSALKY